MSDLLEVLISGTLRDTPRLIQQGGETHTVATVVVRRSSMTPTGALHTTTLALPIAIVDAARAHRFKHHQPGSHIVARGHLELGDAGQLVLIVEHLLDAAPPATEATSPASAATASSPAQPATQPPTTPRGAPSLRAPWDR